MQVRLAEVVTGAAAVLTGEEKARVRADVFHHLAGIAVAPTVKALTDRCGDGNFLEHLYNVVRTRTQRGQMLDRHPLRIIGADFNKVARRVTSRTLRA
jgi:hypothetical protein